MKRILFILCLLFSIQNTNAQVKYETIESSKLGETREIKIQLPRGYETDEDKTYPVFIVLDGDYLFEAVAGNIDYYSYWEDMPESIIVGINQVETRYDDSMYSAQNSLPIDEGAEFFEFVGLELIPYINKTYRTTNFRGLIGHGETANFINYFLLKQSPVFKSYVVVSPDLAPGMLEYIPERLNKLESKIFYYLANTDNDPASIKKMSDALNEDISKIDNNNLSYKFDSFKGPSHYAAPTHAIPNALEEVFEIYEPISKKEYKETILELEISPVLYLTEKYQEIEETFGLKKKIIINDFKAISAAIEKNQTFEYYEALGELARKHYSETILGGYYLGRFYEETGEPKKALRTYESAYILSEIAGITKDMVLDRASSIKEDFGY